jgi:quercetin dioxygenase-like cupin family protein
MTQDERAIDTALTRAVDLAELVVYQADSIVSRTLIKKPTGTVTLFAFDAGQELSEHTAPFDALVQVVDGVGELTVGGSPARLATGQAIIMPAGVPHSVRAGERFKMLLTMVRS